jgi:predicted ATPase/DNA-binding XRE family transcriptional regulator
LDKTASFGTWIRKRRRALDLTQAELADRVGCAEVTVRKIESDARRPSRLMAERLADSLEIEPDSRDRFIGAARAFISPSRLRWPVGPVGFGDSGVPVPLTSFVGRGDELNELAGMAAFTGGASRLLTLTGPPGVGKTRLAQELAILAERKYDIPAVFVDLAPLTDPDEIANRIAAAIAVPAGPGASRLELALLTLGRAPSLLVLDNFEHLLVAAPIVTTILDRCPQLTCVVTSRVRLDLYGETEYPLLPLAVPSPMMALAANDLDDWPSVRLFVDRADVARRGASLGDELGQIAEICRLLDGLPLAIELAAQRTRHVPVETLAQELAVDLTGLESRTRDRDARQRSVRGAVQWSYDLLDPRVQRVLRSASVFDGVFDGESLAFVAGLDPTEAGHALAEVVDCSLLRSAGYNSYSMLAVVRSFGRTELEHHDEAVQTQRRFAQYFTEYAEKASSEVAFWAGHSYLETLDAEIDNISAAISWAFGPDGDSQIGQRLTAAAGVYLTLRGRTAEGARWAQHAFEVAEEPADRVGPGFTWAECVWAQGDLDTAERLLEEVEELARHVGDTQWLPLILHDRGFFRLISGDLAGAQAAFDESLILSAGTGSTEAIALSHMRLGLLAIEKREYDQAERENDLALSSYRQLEDGWGVATALGQRGDISLGRGRPEEAMERYAESVAGYLDAGFDWFAASRVENIGNTLAAAGRFETAATIYGLADQWLGDLAMPPHPLTARARPDYESESRNALGSSYDEAHQLGCGLPRALQVLYDVIGSTRAPAEADRR